LSLQAPGAAGAGAITFAYGAAATLIIGAGDIPANIVSGFLPGDVIDLQGIGAATSAVLGAGDILTISGGTSSVQLALDPAQNFTGESFLTVSDHNGGTLLTAANVGNDFPPSISGTGTVTGNDHAPLSPLAGVTVSDLDPGQTETVTVTLSSPLNGTLSNLSGGAYDAVNGIYTVTGNAAAVTAALDALVFTPTAYQVAPGQTVTTVFNLLATDGLMFSSAAATTVNITALNDPPAISGVGGALVEGYWNVPLNPFTAGAIADPDAGATESVTFTLGQFPYGATDSSGTLSLSLPGFTLTHTGAGTYALSAGTPAAVTQAIQALQFTALPNPAVPGYTITYVTMSVSDGIAPPVTAAAEVLTGLPIFSGVTTNQSVVDGQSISPFSSVAVTDSAGLTIQGMSITLFDSSSNYLNPTDANGTLSGANLVKTGVGSYTLTPGSTASVTAELDALVFTPTLSNATVTTYFNLSAFDGATTANNGNTSVIALPGPSLPVIAGTVAGQSVADNTTIAPFATVAVTDANPTPADSATITLIDVATGTTSDANGRLSGAGLTETAPGVYQLAATDPASLTAELDAIIFTPTPYQVPAGQTVTTEFLLAVADGALASSNGSTSVVVTATSANRAWQGPGIANPSGDWNVAANWNPAAVPFSASIASINVAGTYAVTSNQTNTVAGLVIGDAGATLVINGGLFTLLGSSSNAGAIAIGDAAALQLTGTMTNSGTITLASAGAATGLVIAGSASLKGAGSVAMTDAAGNAILSNGAAATLTNASTIAGSGAIGDANLKLINAAGGVIDATGGANALTVNTGSNAVKNSGTLEATNGGDLIVAGAVANNGTLLEQGGVLKIGGALSGTGQATIAGGTLELGAGVVATQTVTFAAGAAGTLKLDRAQSFAGTVAGLAAGDAIDLANFQFSKTPTIAGVTGTGAAGSTTVVTVVDGTLTEKLTLLNQFANQFAVSPSAYTLAADSNPLSHGTLFRLAAPAP
jgi:hypothetical protein